jgi:DNA helicase II / ATP-dependent DNA helicase PcrA
LVDEVQDTNIQQMEMLITLAKVIPTSVMVGDPKQSINGFRGAYAENWETIRTKLDTCVYQLTKTQRVPRASLSFINAIGDEIYSGTPLNSNIKGRRIRLIGCKNTVEQAKFIAHEIKLLIKSNKVRPEEIVCLGRTQRLLSDLSIALEGHDIETQELYREPKSSHEKGLRNLLRLTRWLRQYKNKDGFVFPEKRRRTLISWLKRLGAKTEEIDKIFQKMPKEGWKALSITSHLKMEQGKKWKKRRGPENPAYRGVLKFQKLIGQAAESEELEKAIAYLMDALRKVLRRRFNSKTFGFLMSDLSRLKINSRQFNGWDDLRVKKLQLPIKNNQDCVQLSTINGAKGKEWKYVFVIHCVQGILPIHNTKNDQKLDEERNLFYVAITRHKKALYLMEAPGSMVNYHPKRGKHNKHKHDVLFSERSSFITPHKKYLCDLNATNYFLDHATDSKSIG